MNREINKSIAGILLAKNRKNFQPNLTLKTERRRESEVTLNFDPVDRNRGSNAEIGKNSCVKNLRERKREVRRRRRAANSDFIARLPYCRPDKSYFYHSRTRRDVCECAAHECACERKRERD